MVERLDAFLNISGLLDMEEEEVEVEFVWFLTCWSEVDEECGGMAKEGV